MTLIVDHSALLAWSPNLKKDGRLACGTFHSREQRTVDCESVLELFDYSSESVFRVGSLSVPSYFNRIKWIPCSLEKEFILGAFDDGSLGIYDVQMLSNSTQHSISTPKIHTEAIKGLDYSSFNPNLIVSGGINGEIALWDLSNLSKASLIGQMRSEKFSTVSDLAWSPLVPQIIAVSSGSGVVAIFDVRCKKEVTSIQIADIKSISSISWNPRIPTSLLLASDNDSQPSVYTWDLKCNNSPTSIFKGHSKGVLKLSFCPSNPELVLSASKDGTILCWDSESNDILKTFSDKGVFDVQWNPFDSNMFSTSSHHGSFIRSVNNSTHSDKNLKSSEAALQNPSSCASFSKTFLCSTTGGINSRILLVRPKIHKESSICSDLVVFESNLIHGRISELLKHFSEKETVADRSIIWKLLLALFSSNTQYDVLQVMLNDCTDENNQALKLNNHPLKTFDQNGTKHSTNQSTIEKILNSNFEGAMLDYIDSGRFYEALAVSSCGDNVLRKKAETLILENEFSFDFNLALCIKNGDFSTLVYSSSLVNWKNILHSLCKFSPAEDSIRLFQVLGSRLYHEGMQYQSLYPYILAGNIEQIIIIILKRFYISTSSSIGISDYVDSVDFCYKIIRLLYYLNPPAFNCFKDISLKITIIEIYTKIKSLLFTFGFKYDLKFGFIDDEFYDNHIKGRDPEIDFLNSHYDSQMIDTPKFPDTINQSHANKMTNQNVTSPRVSDPGSTLKMNRASIMYNDVPVIIHKLSPAQHHRKGLRAVGDLVIHAFLEIEFGDVSKAIERLFLIVESRHLSESNSRIIKEINRKLAPESICAKEYSFSASLCIYELFSEINDEKIVQASASVTNILTSFFSETKDWILHLKRLIDLAKIK